jgi:hypothetical protein
MPRAGARVRVTGLQKKTELNGSLGTVKGAVDGGRFCVLLDGEAGRELSLKPENFSLEAAGRAIGPDAPFASVRCDAALLAAGVAAHAGKWRQCADLYLQAYMIADSGWIAKYNSWSGYTSVLREDHFVASKGDLEVLKRVAKDESVPRLDRSRAHMTRGYVLYSLGDREGAARSYRQAMVLCKAATAEERTRNVLLPDERAMKLLPTPSGPIFDDTLKTASENLASIELPAQMDTQSIAESMATRFQENLEIGQEPQQAFDQAFADGMPKFLTPIGPNVANLASTKLELDRLMTVSGSVCDHCGGARGAKGITLLKCKRCGLAYYCSIECQKAQWKAGHKAACRAPGEVKVGDRLMLENVANIDEYHGMYNGMIVEVQRASSEEGRWDVGMVGGEIGKCASIATTELKRLRPVA